jgi:putative flippase GtrA
MPKLRREVLVFLIVGVTAVIFDFTSYRVGLWAYLPVHVAKATGFLVGAIFAYFANRHWTFQASETWHGWPEVARFIATYAGSLVCNIGANGLVLLLLGTSEKAILAAFTLATGISATLNFLGMRYFVFNSRYDRHKDGDA